MRRLNEGLIQPLERPVLRWLAERMPGWVTPDMLTTVGFIGAFMAGAGYWLASVNPWMLLLASLGLVVNWFGDSLDGTLARFRKIERPTYGFFVDHTTDVFEQVVIGLGIALSGFYSFELAVLCLIVYLLLSTLSFARAQHLSTLQISYAWFGPTELRLSMIATNIAILLFPPWPMSLLGVATTWPNLLAAMWCIGGGTVLVVQTALTLRQLKAESAEPPA